jgi:serine/threonine protein kinase
MCKDEARCNYWVSLISVGIPVEGCIRDTTWLRTIRVPCNHSIINDSYYVDNGTTKLQCISNIAHGTFGTIDIGILTMNSITKRVYIKKPIRATKSLLYEACIQKLVHEGLESIGYENGTPKIEYIFRLNDGSVCFAMEPIENAKTLCEFIKNTNKVKFQEIIMDCLLQICGMLWYLEKEYGLNHRDLKPSNFLIYEHDVEKKVIIVEDVILEIDSKYSISFIDFGFSCIGDNGISEISLSTVYSKSDPCPKEGRDLYLFISFIYVDYHTKMSDELIGLFEKWLHIPNTNILSFIKRHGIKSKEWIYFLTGNPSITEFKSRPYRIIRDLYKLMYRN